MRLGREAWAAAGLGVVADDVLATGRAAGLEATPLAAPRASAVVVKGTRPCGFLERPQFYRAPPRRASSDTSSQ